MFVSRYLYEGVYISNFQSDLGMPNPEGRLEEMRSLQKWDLSPWTPTVGPCISAVAWCKGLNMSFVIVLPSDLTGEKIKPRRLCRGLGNAD